MNEHSTQRLPVTQSNEVCVSQLKVLADATRLSVMRCLLREPQRVSDLRRRLDVEQSLLSHHLRVLKEAGLVLDERVGKSVRYRLAPEVRMDPEGESIHLGCCRLSFDP